MSNFIFLGIDGVLNSARTQMAFQGHKTKTLDRVSIALIAKLAPKLMVKS